MKSRLLTFDDLYNFYSKYTRAKHFNCIESGGEPIVVQTPGVIKFEKNTYYYNVSNYSNYLC